MRSRRQDYLYATEMFAADETEKTNAPAGVRSAWGVVLLAVFCGFAGGALGAWLVVGGPKVRNEAGKPAELAAPQRIAVAEDSAVVDVVKRAGPAVVSIVISKDISQEPISDFSFPFFGFPQQRPSTPDIQPVGAGSGFFVSGDGLILTNRHVVSDERASYTVLTSDGKRHEAKVLARDPVNDLAIIKVEVKDAPKLELADSGKVEIGQRVIAIGYSLGQYQNTVTTGVVSGIGRSIVAGSLEGEEQLEGVIQTDAAINPGNSGGPLLNVAGQVIGINTAIDREGQLVGFAIPSSDAARALESFRKTGRITRPFLGVRYLMVTEVLATAQGLPKDYGALVVRGEQLTDFAVVPGSPADKAGIVENDIILEVNGQRVDPDHTLARLLKPLAPNDTVTLKVYHRGEEKVLTVVLTEAK